MIESNSNIKEDILKEKRGWGILNIKGDKKYISTYLRVAKMFLKEKREEGGKRG